MKKLFISAVLASAAFFGSAQNLIDNPDFESGTAINLVGTTTAFINNVTDWTAGCTVNQSMPNTTGGSPDLFDANSVFCQYGVPSNKLAGNRQVNIPGTSRYVGFAHRESILGKINAPLTQCEYNFEFYYAPREGYQYCTGNYTPYTTSYNTVIEVVLRNSSNPCGGGSVVYSEQITLTSGVNAQWQLSSGSFTLTAAQVSANYDRIEIRQQNQTGTWVYIDDILMEKSECSSADVEPLNEIGVTNMNSLYGQTEVFRYCENEVFVDGSGSALETYYTIEVTAFNLNTWTNIGTNYTTSWVSGQAPSSIDLEALFGITFQVGVVYQVKLSVGPAWDADFMYFVIEECCPDDIQLELNCELGVVEVLNLPSGIANVSGTWTYKKKQLGVGVIIQSQTLGFTPFVSTSNGAGWYELDITFTMPNGMECSYLGSIYWSEDVCCQIQGPQFEAVLIPSSIESNLTVQTIPWGTLSLPVVSCDGFRLLIETSCYTEEPASYYVGLDLFDPIAWQPTAFVYSNANYISSTHPIVSTSALFGTFQSQTWYILTICDGSDCSYLIFKTDICGGNKGKRLTNVAETSSNVSLYPNPTSGITALQLDEKISGKIIIRSIEGKEILSTKVVDLDYVQFDMTSLPVGAYFIEIHNKGKIVTKKLIKQ